MTGPGGSGVESSAGRHERARNIAQAILAKVAKARNLANDRREKPCIINAEEYRSRWGARASKPGNHYDAITCASEDGKTADAGSTTYGGNGKTSRRIWPHIRDAGTVALALLAAVLLWAIIMHLWPEPGCPTPVVIGDALRLAGCGR